MTGAPPPDALVLAVAGLRGPAERQAVLAAIAAVDPAAATWVDMGRGLVAIRSGAPAGVLRDAVARAGFAARAPGARPGALGVLARTLLFGAGGIALGLALGVLFGLGNSLFNPSCVGSGNCAIGVGVFGALGALVGAPVGLVAGLVSGLARRG